MHNTIIALRTERQHLTKQATPEQYDALYRDMQPGQNVYWNGFGDPPSLTFRADFDDIAYNKSRQNDRRLVKGRFQGGNLGWVEQDDLELFACMTIKPMTKFTTTQQTIWTLLQREGPMNIALMKEMTGLLVKEITPALHRLQEAFLIYEDQYDGEWDRAWYRFEEMFPNVDLTAYTRIRALKIIVQRFAYRNVCIDADMVKSFYKLPVKDIKTAISELATEGVLVPFDEGYVLKSDVSVLEQMSAQTLQNHSVFALHRNDFLYKSNEHWMKEHFKPFYETLPYDHEPLQYLLIDGEFRGVVVGHFRNGVYDLNDVVVDMENAPEYETRIVEAVALVNYGHKPKRFMGNAL